MRKAKLKVASLIEHNGKLDIGCGKQKREGFTGIDQFAMEGVDHVMDVRDPWPIADESVEEIHCSHFLEHLTGVERVKFFNEAYRVMKPGAKLTIITPHWASNRAYGDFTHAWPPVSEMGYYYVNKDWRKTQAPHTDAEFNPDGYTCHFSATWGYSMRQDITTRNQEYQMYAMANYRDALQDMIATLVKA